MRFYHLSKVSVKGQIVISKELRKSHGMMPGTKVILMPGKDQVRVRALNYAYFQEFAGRLGTDGRALNELLRSRRDGERHPSMYSPR